MRESIIVQDYKNYLINQGLSKATVDNYLVDAVKFLGWLSLYLQQFNFSINPKDPSTYIVYINSKTIQDFQEFLLKNEASRKTLNRRLISLKKFLDFTVNEGYLIKNPALPLKNIPAEEYSFKISFKSQQAIEETLKEFKQWLEDKKTTNTTVKNYCSDIRHFLNWLQK